MNTSLVKYSTKVLSIVCACMLFIAVLKLPIEYYRLLRIIVFAGAILVINENLKKQTHWIVIFTLIAILFNPIFPIYLYKKSIWIPLDIIAGILFLLETFIKKPKKVLRKIEKKEQKTYERDRIL